MKLLFNLVGSVIASTLIIGCLYLMYMFHFLGLNPLEMIDYAGFGALPVILIFFGIPSFIIYCCVDGLRRMAR